MNAECSGRLLFVCKNHLRAFILPRLQVGLASVLAHILFASLDGRKLLTLDLTSLLNRLGKVTLAFDAANLGHVRVSLDESLVVLQFGSLACALDSTAVRGLGTPETNIAIVRSRQNILAIRSELGRENTVFVISQFL